MTRFVCIHGHFYQPPRENPWIESIERQPSAHPYSDWNARITAECYGPNARARMLDGDNRISDIVSNYERMSFNFGPSLLAWMETEAPKVYASILAADKASMKRFGGHGSAMAQGHGHLILPLANHRDKRTQVLWGKQDFISRFGREPEGMWLAETAADTPSLEALAEAGIKFTVLAPGQAARTRKIGAEEWSDVSGGRVGPRRAYQVNLPSGKSIAVFFYDGPISQGVAFENLLEHGHRLADRLTRALLDDREEAQLVHIATDGETYGHHHRFGEMALASALDMLEKREGVQLTNYGQFLAEHPPQWEAEIIEGRSWSCAHGIERWRSDCGCSTGGEPSWNQRWRRPLRESLDWLRDRINEDFQSLAGKIFDDPWVAREDYIRVMLDRREENVAAFLADHASRLLSGSERVQALRLLEMSRHAMSMFTSCGWFFDELSRIEGVQVLCYADRAASLCRRAGGGDHVSGFLEKLEEAVSNIPEQGNGRDIFERSVRTSRVKLVDVGAHFGASTLYETPAETSDFYAFRIRRKDARVQSGESAKLAVGLAAVSSTITGAATQVAYCFYDPGNHNLIGGAREFQGRKNYDRMVWAITDRFFKGETEAVHDLLEEHFPGATYTLESLLRDDREKIIDRILMEARAETARVYTKLFESRAGVYRFLEDRGISRPRELDAAAESVLGARVRESLESDVPDFQAAVAAIDEAKKAGVSDLAEEAAFHFTCALERIGTVLRKDPARLDILELFERGAGLAPLFDGSVNLWQVQNDFWSLKRSTLPGCQQRAKSGDSSAQRWVELFLSLSDKLNFAV